MSNSPISPELLEKYLAGASSAEETRRIENWYAKQTGEKDYLSTLSDLDAQLLEEDTLKKIKGAVGIPLDNQEETPPKLSFWRNRLFQLGVAASFLLVCWGGWHFFETQNTVKKQETMFALIEPVKENAVTHFVNTQGKLITHRLPDGTQVSLYPNAELTYPKVFDGKTRQVTFIGAGYFDVAHDAAHPFLIHSDKMQIRVLGTKFSVKALPKEAIFQVSVLSGSVAVRSIRADGQANPGVVLLKPQQKALFEVSTNQLKTLDAVADSKKEIFEAISINFNDAPVSTVVNQLEKQFNIRIELSDKALSKCLLTADFNNQSLPTILEILCASLDATYTLSGDSLVLKGAGCE